MKKLAVVLLLAVLMSACAKKQAAPAAAPAEQAKAPAIPQMSQEEMMSKVKEAATPGEEHAKLAPLVGKWKTETKFWMDPSKAPEVTKGTASNQWILGKRFLKQDFTGKFAGQAFQGTGVLGYDKVKKAYVSTWSDSMGTGIMTSEGNYDSASNSLEMNGKYSCPLTNGEMTGRAVTRIVNKKEHVFEMYGPGPDGKEYKNLEITYKRVS